VYHAIVSTGFEVITAHHEKEKPMLDVADYKLQYSSVNFNTVLADAPDVFITEAAPIAGTPQLTDAQVAQLTAAGTKVFGYVDSSVTDSGRPYWNTAWTSDGTDMGTPTDAAPDWLKTGVTNPFGIVTDIRDPAWKQIVIDQCVDLVSRGYSGIFLDDVSQYFILGRDLGDTDGWARAMLQLVIDVEAAIDEVNPDAELIINSTPYITSDAMGDPTSEALINTFNSKVDAMLLEVFFGISFAPEEAGIQQAVDAVKPHMTVLTLEYGGTPYQRYLFKKQSIELGFVAGVSEDESYSSYGASIAWGTNDADVLRGTRRDDNIVGYGGNDQIYGSDGKDTIRAGAGDDVLRGDAGRDMMTGNKGRDILRGGSDADTFKFAFGDSGTILRAIDVIKDFEKGAVDIGDAIDFEQALKIDATALAAASDRATINAKGLANFAAGSGTTFTDAINDIANAMSSDGNIAGEFAFYKIKNTGDYFLYVSDGKSGFSSMDVIIKLEGVAAINTLQISNGDLIILS
jgi:uncharacterized protein (TIGR01370 family)